MPGAPRDGSVDSYHGRMVGLVKRMLALHRKLVAVRIERERTVIGYQIEATDRQLDRLVYEIRIVGERMYR